MKNTNEIANVSSGFKCQKKWTDLEGESNMRLCSSCNINVHNFEELTTQEIIDFLMESKGKKICAKYKASQIQEINTTIQNQSKSAFFKPIAFASVLLTLLACGSINRAQPAEYLEPKSKIVVIKHNINTDSLSTILIRGKLLDVDKEPLILVNLFIGGVDKKFNSDIDGNFEISIPKTQVDTAKFSVDYIGYKKVEINLSEIKNKQVEIELVEEVFLIGEVHIKEPYLKRINSRIKRMFSTEVG